MVEVSTDGKTNFQDACAELYKIVGILVVSIGLGQSSLLMRMTDSPEDRNCPPDLNYSFEQSIEMEDERRNHQAWWLTQGHTLLQGFAVIDAKTFPDFTAGNVSTFKVHIRDP